MLPQHRILPEPLPTMPVERERTVIERRPADNNQRRQDFDSAMAASKQRQNDRRVDDVNNKRRPTVESASAKRDVQHSANKNERYDSNTIEKKLDKVKSNVEVFSNRANKSLNNESEKKLASIVEQVNALKLEQPSVDAENKGALSKGLESVNSQLSQLIADLESLLASSKSNMSGIAHDSLNSETGNTEISAQSGSSAGLQGLLQKLTNFSKDLAELLTMSMQSSSGEVDISDIDQSLIKAVDASELNNSNNTQSTASDQNSINWLDNVLQQSKQNTDNVAELKEKPLEGLLKNVVENLNAQSGGALKESNQATVGTEPNKDIKNKLSDLQSLLAFHGAQPESLTKEQHQAIADSLINVAFDTIQPTNISGDELIDESLVLQDATLTAAELSRLNQRLSQSQTTVAAETTLLTNATSSNLGATQNENLLASAGKQNNNTHLNADLALVKLAQSLNSTQGSVTPEEVVTKNAKAEVTTTSINQWAQSLKVNQSTAEILKANGINLAGGSQSTTNSEFQATSELAKNVVNASVNELKNLNSLDGLSSNDLSKPITNLLTPTDLSLLDASDKPKASMFEVMGVQLDRTLQAPKLESVAQARHELIVKENILFNKQELAANMQQQVGLMLARNMKSVDIRLDPPELGSMQIKLNIGAEQASVSFVVSNQQAKDALENSLPKLRELLEQQGLELADSDVKKDDSKGQNQDASDGDEEITKNALNNPNAANSDEETDASQINDGRLAASIKSPWQVDYYA